MASTKDNLNPAVLDSLDLPSRETAKQPGLFASLASPYPSPAGAAFWSSEALSADLSDDGSLRTSASDDEGREEIDEQEVYDLISTILDPEHPLTLGSLGVVNLDDIKINQPTSARSRISSVRVLITPTTSACSLTTVIGLGVKVRLMNALPPRFRIDVQIKEGTSSSAHEANKQLGDKERVAAAMENRNLINMVNHMLSNCA